MSFMYVMRLAAVLVLCLPTATMAATEAAVDSEDNSRPAELDPITVVAHRQPRQLSEVAGTVTVIDADRLERDLVMDVADLVRYEPGMAIDNGSNRFGFGGFRIRGLGGNRTAVVVDNMPVADQFDVGAFADTGRGLLELGLVRRVEILRGPASTLYGSKALGGVVAISTVNASDVIAAGDAGTRIGLQGASDSDRIRLNAAAAMRHDSFDFMAAIVGRRGDEIRAAGRPDDTPRDRLERKQQSALLKAGHDTLYGRLQLTLDASQETRKSDIRAALGHSAQFANTTLLLGDDRREALRLLIDQDLAALGPVSRGHWRVWHQSSDTRQETRDLRPVAPVPVDVYRRFEFDQKTTGAGADLESDLQTGTLHHRFGYGFEYSQSRVSNLRHGLETHLEDGHASNVILGEVFPLRDFPRSRVSELGIYLHDEIRLWRGGPTLSPGVRWEYYDLSLGRDALFEQSYPEAETTELSTSSWQPRLGLVWPLNGSMELFAQYARGLRAPPFSDVNIGLEYAQMRVRAIANPDLKPEKGRTVEAGLRWRGQSTLAELAVFRNDYRDFIQTRAPMGLDPASGFMIFQSINRDRVRIEGGELRLRQQLGAGLSLELAGEWSRGRDLNTDMHLPDVSPPRAIVELGWESADARLESRLIATATRRQRALTDNDGTELFSPPGHASIDWLSRWNVHRDVDVSLGLFNLANRTYWTNSRVAGLESDDPNLPLLAEAGRWAMLNLVWQY